MNLSPRSWMSKLGSRLLRSERNERIEVGKKDSMNWSNGFMTSSNGLMKSSKMLASPPLRIASPVGSRPDRLWDLLAFLSVMLFPPRILPSLVYLYKFATARNSSAEKISLREGSEARSILPLSSPHGPSRGTCLGRRKIGGQSAARPTAPAGIPLTVDTQVRLPSAPTLKP